MVTRPLRIAMRTSQWRLAGPLLRNAVSLIPVSRFEAAASREMPASATRRSR